MISPSEYDTYLACQYKHYFGFGEKLQSRNTSEAISRGNAGHAALQSFYEGLLLGNSYETSRQLAMLTALKQNIDPKVLEGLVSLLQEYFDFYEFFDKRLKILAVEKTFVVNGIPFTPDVIWKDLTTGKISIIDHKIIYNFYSRGVMDLAPQMPRYAGLLKLDGLPVDNGYYNMLRYRPNAKEKFLRAEVKFTEAKTQKYVGDMLKTLPEMEELKSLPKEVWKSRIRRSASTYTCDHCQFQKLCYSDLEGLAGQNLLIQSEYEPNTYNYDHMENE